MASLRVVGALLVTLTASLAAASPVITSPSAGTRVNPGEIVEIRWSALEAGGSESADELELLMSLDGGVHFARLTGQLSADTTSYSWRVPSLPASRVLLALRVGREGDEGLEAWSAPFEIGTGVAHELEPISFHDGELWTGRSVARELPLGSLDSSSPRLSVVERDHDLLHETFDLGGAPVLVASSALKSVEPSAPSSPVVSSIAILAPPQRK